MAFVDEIQFSATAGRGGDGVVRWRKEKYENRGGPWGGDGGKGGDVYIEGVRDIARLSRIMHITSYKAERGKDGASASKTGKSGEDLVIELPVGSIVTNLDTGARFELLSEGERLKILEGGAGGLGNEHFKSSTNVAPDRATPGKPGEEGRFKVELQLIADAGLVGFPNAGKSSLLNALTNASAKVGAYPFTTLDPNLGVYHRFVIADIPGLIEGASSGKGLGHKFLRHVKRTKILLHLISLEEEDPVGAYATIRSELNSFDAELGKKDEYIVLTKTDLATPERVAEVSALFEEKGKTVLAISILDDASLKAVGDTIARALTTPESVSSDVA